MGLSLTAFSPAKINLFLAITGKRPDGFHNLVSLVAPLAWGDSLWFEPMDAPGFSLSCDVPELPVDASNLILKAAQAFAAAAELRSGGRFVLTKRIPMGAGLGGGSSNASTALLLLNAAHAYPLSSERLSTLAAGLGSDCPLFLAGKPVLMRGRGERLSPLPEHQCARLSGRRLLVFKPAFGISTPWAYGQLAAGAPESYLPEPHAEQKLANWFQEPGRSLDEILFNNMEQPAFSKYLALPALLDSMRALHGLQPRMSGSGSACFVILPERFEIDPLIRLIKQAWGETAFVQETRVL